MGDNNSLHVETKTILALHGEKWESLIQLEEITVITKENYKTFHF